MMNRYNIYVSLALAAISAVSCQEITDLDRNEPNVGSRDIKVSAEMTDTKAPLTGPCLEYPLGLFALSTGSPSGLYLYADNNQFTGHDEYAKKTNTVFSGGLEWPEYGELRFAGYSPYMEGVVAQISGSEDDWTMDVTIPVNNNCPDQSDLVGACDLTRTFGCASHTDEPVPMEYDHLLSSVQLEFWSETPLYITDVSFNNVCVEATQHLSATSATSEWDGEWINRVSPTEPYSMMAGSGNALLLSREEECPSPVKESSLVYTGRTLDLGIDDEYNTFHGAYFQVEANGELVYTRNGRFHLNQDGTVVDESGYILQPEFAVPPETAAVSVSKFGYITALDADGGELAGAYIPLYTFIAEEWLEPYDDSHFTPTEHSGDEVECVPGEDGAPVIFQGYINSSEMNYGKSDTQLEVAIRDNTNTPSYFAVNYNGMTLYTRDGRFTLNEDGYIVDTNEPAPNEHDWVYYGAQDDDRVCIECNTPYLSIFPDGTISAPYYLHGYHGGHVGRLKSYVFSHPEFLAAQVIRDRIYYSETAESGTPTEGCPFFQYGARNVRSAYTETEPCTSMRKFLCIPDRTEDEPETEVPAGRSISITVMPLDTPGASPKTKVFSIDNEFVQGHCYTYKINCSKILDD